MQFTSTIIVALASLASSQKVHVVTVSSANNSLTYSPENLKADKGDMVQFQFVAGNHTVTQSAFDRPCMPIKAVQPNVTGFHSGFMPAAASKASGQIPTYTIQVKDTTPMWIYCAQGPHCEKGMVMVINENTAKNASRSLTAYKQLAAQQKSSTAPATPVGGSASSESGSGAGMTGMPGMNGTTSPTGTKGGSNSTADTATKSGTKPATTAGAGMVTVSGSLGLLVAAAAVLLL